MNSERRDYWSREVKTKEQSKCPQCQIEDKRSKNERRLEEKTKTTVKKKIAYNGRKTTFENCKGQSFLSRAKQGVFRKQGV